MVHAGGSKADGDAAEGPADAAEVPSVIAGWASVSAIGGVDCTALTGGGGPFGGAGGGIASGKARGAGGGGGATSAWVLSVAPHARELAPHEHASHVLECDVLGSPPPHVLGSQELESPPLIPFGGEGPRALYPPGVRAGSC